MPSTTSDELKEFFSEYGEVANIEKLYMRPKATVTFKSPLSVKILLSNPPDKMRNKRITVTANQERYFIRVSSISDFHHTQKDVKTEELHKLLSEHFKVVSIDLRNSDIQYVKDNYPQLLEKIGEQPAEVQDLMKAFAIVEVAGKDDITAAIGMKHEHLKIKKYERKVL